MNKLILAIVAVLLLAAPAHAAGICNKETTRVAHVTSASQIVTNTTQVRLCGIEVWCSSACQYQLLKHAGSTSNFKGGLGSAGQGSVDFTRYSSGGYTGIKLGTMGLYWSPASANTDALVLYELY